MSKENKLLLLLLLLNQWKQLTTIFLLILILFLDCTNLWQEKILDPVCLNILSHLFLDVLQEAMGENQNSFQIQLVRIDAARTYGQ